MYFLLYIGSELLEQVILDELLPLLWLRSCHFLTHNWVLLIADGNTGIQTLLFLCVCALWVSLVTGSNVTIGSG